MNAAMFERQVKYSDTETDTGKALKDGAVFCALRSGLKVMDDASAKGWADHLNETFFEPLGTVSCHTVFPSSTQAY